MENILIRNTLVIAFSYVAVGLWYTVFFLFTALHVKQTRYSEENSVRPSVRPSVCLSVCPSVTRVIPGKTEERSVQIFIPYERTFIVVF